MKKLFALALCLTLGLTYSFAQAEKATEAIEKATETGPVMSFESTEVDYGNIIQESDPFRFFKFTNTGNEPLIISRVYSSCGCTIPKKPEDPILPGQDGEIEVKYDTKRVGPIRKTISVYSNAGATPYPLKIKGTITEEKIDDEKSEEEKK